MAYYHIFDRDNNVYNIIKFRNEDIEDLIDLFEMHFNLKDVEVFCKFSDLYRFQSFVFINYTNSVYLVTEVCLGIFKIYNCCIEIFIKEDSFKVENTIIKFIKIK